MDLTSAHDAIEIDLSPKAERAVARQFMGRVQWEMVLIGTGQALVWITTFVLTILGTIPLWLGFVIATVCCCVAYLPSHEAQHGNLSGRQERWRWLDPLVGQLSLVPLALGYDVARVTHLKHHAHTNDPDQDPDYKALGQHWWEVALAVHRGPNERALAHHMASDARFRAGLMRGVVVIKLLRLVLLVMVVLFPLPTLLVWWLPRAIAQSYLFVFFSWEPHRPGTATGRYHDTRFWRFYEGRMKGHVERVEQAGNRITITTGGLVHDMFCDGTLENGQDDVAGIGGRRILVAATYEEGMHKLRPFDKKVVAVTRKLDGDEMVWRYGVTRNRLRRLEAPPLGHPATRAAAEAEGGTS